VPYNAGGVYAFTRPVAPRLTEQLGQPVVVGNHGCAGATIGVLHAARSPADGPPSSAAACTSPWRVRSTPRAALLHGPAVRTH